MLEEVDALGGTTASAYQTLGLQKGASAADIKSAHRKMIVTLHPDRVSSLPEAEQAAARQKFEQVQAAYEILGGGSGDSTESWYENLGSGRADFFRSGACGHFPLPLYAWLPAPLRLCAPRPFHLPSSQTLLESS